MVYDLLGCLFGRDSNWKNLPRTWSGYLAGDIYFCYLTMSKQPKTNVKNVVTFTEELEHRNRLCFFSVKSMLCVFISQFSRSSLLLGDH